MSLAGSSGAGWKKGRERLLFSTKLFADRGKEQQ